MSGWDDPRMPTLCGLRRRGYTAASIRDFLNRVGVAKADSVVETSLLEHCVRDDLNNTANRLMAVVDPVKVTITNWRKKRPRSSRLKTSPAGKKPAAARCALAARSTSSGRFMEDPPKKFFRLSPGREVRLKSAYVVKCEGVEKDGEGR